MRPPAAARAALADAVLPSVHFTTADVIAQARAAGLAISVWTLDDPAQAGELTALGVDAIATDHPGRMLSALG